MPQGSAQLLLNENPLVSQTILMMWVSSARIASRTPMCLQGMVHRVAITQASYPNLPPPPKVLLGTCKLILASLWTFPRWRSECEEGGVWLRYACSTRTQGWGGWSGARPSRIIRRFSMPLRWPPSPSLRYGILSAMLVQIDNLLETSSNLVRKNWT